MSDKNPLAYTGRVSGSTKQQGDVQFNATQFSVTDGVVTLAGGGLAIDTVAGDSGTATPTAAGLLTIAGGASITTSATSNTATIALDATVPQQAQVTLTAAEVKALATKPIELVAAPAAGKALVFLGATFKLVYGSEVFAEAGDNLGIKYTDAAGVQVSATIETTGFIDQSANTYTSGIAANDAIVVATGAEAKALVLDNLNANITGNASNDSTLVVSVLYRVVTM
jgi:hypothetical protein